MHAYLICLYIIHQAEIKDSIPKFPQKSNFWGWRSEVVWVLQGFPTETRVDKVDTLKYCYLQDSSQPFWFFSWNQSISWILGYEYFTPVKCQVILGPRVRKKQSIWAKEAEELHQVDVEALSRALSGPRTGRVASHETFNWMIAFRKKKENHRLKKENIILWRKCSKPSKTGIFGQRLILLLKLPYFFLTIAEFRTKDLSSTSNFKDTHGMSHIIRFYMKTFSWKTSLALRRMLQSISFLLSNKKTWGLLVLSV